MESALTHQEIGQQQKLYFFDVSSPGSCFFLPHGTHIYNKLTEIVRKQYKIRGYSEVITPNIYHVDLWKTSGHYDNYHDNMFMFKIKDDKDDNNAKDDESNLYALKPMNCAGHCVMFKQMNLSYRELPIRIADFGVLHRNELSGALRGLTRVRRFQQDDAHIFCDEDDLNTELKQCLEFIKDVYGMFGFEFDIELSTHPDKYIGDITACEKSEKILETVLNEYGYPWRKNNGGGAFYGPKIDIHIKDHLKRSHQCATIQLDFNLPKRFELKYQSRDNDKIKTPVMIHRAIYGSFERFIAILAEHTQGNWPLCISPRQVMIIPVHKDVFNYANTVKSGIPSEYMVDVDLSDNTFSKKILSAEKYKYNYILVVGKKERDAEEVNLRAKADKLGGAMSLDKFIQNYLILS